MSVAKSLYIPAVPVSFNRMDIAERFSCYGQIHRIDFSENYGPRGSEVGDVFIHFYKFNPFAEGGYLAYQLRRGLPMYTFIQDQMIVVRQYTSQYLL